MATTKHISRQLFLGAVALTASVAAAENQADEFDNWDQFDSATTHVNEGSLSFLSTSPATPIHHHQNKMQISAESLSTGWVKLNQCHTHLDQVPRLQITFRKDFVRGLKIIQYENIKKAWVDGHRILLRDISGKAKICISGETRALRISEGGYFELHSGPFMRQFLDGYYPMRVSMQVSFPGNSLQIVNTLPEAQPGFAMKKQSGKISYDTIFEGKLRTMIRFKQTETAAVSTTAESNPI